LAVFEIQRDSVSEGDLLSNYFLDLQRYRHDSFVLRDDSILALVGFPAEINTIGYDEYTIMTRGISVDGRYCGPAEENGCSKIRINSLGALEHMDGLSGSPVLEFTPLGGKFYRPQLAGVLIRRTSASRYGRFVDAPSLYSVLGV